jgi:hypothetical protein
MKPLLITVALFGGCCIAGVLAARAEIPRGPVARDMVDLIEVNHFYDDCGRLVFDQAIYYDWHPVERRHHVRAWRLIKDDSQLPVRDWQQGGYLSVWQDGELLRVVRSSAIRETWSQFDPELAERDALPPDRRRELTKVRGR